ncbi:MAG: hypothetical protein FJ263_10130 [Planctomycetes bacterium]|nr:hypothetical protein [Planctomycetota bacterium]
MFTVEQAVENWKNDLRQKQTLMESDIEELESHLQEEMERLTTLGLSEEESFLIGVRRIGDTTQMASEFAKVNTAAIWKNRFFWMIAGLFVSKIIFSLSSFVGKLSFLIEHYFHWFGWYGAGIFNSVLYGLSLILLAAVFYFYVTRSSFSQKMSKFNTLTTIISTWLLFEIGGLVLQMFPMVIMTKLYSPGQIGQFLWGSQSSMFAVHTVWAVLLISLFILLRPKKMQNI